MRGFRFRQALAAARKSAAGSRSSRPPFSNQFSFEQLEPRLVFAAQLDIGPVPDVVIVSLAQPVGQFSVTTGPELSTNVSAATAMTFAGQTLYQTAGANIEVQSDNFVPVDVTKTYALTGWARSGDEFGLRNQPNNVQSFGFASYDKDLLQILPQNVLKFTGATDTTLSTPLNPGDTTIHLTNAAGWSSAATASALTRGLAWYGYHDSGGTLYADYSYTRNVAMGGATGLWSPGSVNGNVITLASPWTGPALPAGTKVRDPGSGDNATYGALDSQAVPGGWTSTQYAAIFGGQVLQSGNNSVSQFRPGTAFIKPIIISNEQGDTNNFVSWSSVTVSEVVTGTTIADVGPTVVDLSVITGGDQRHAVPQGSLYSAASLVKVDTSQSYTISGQALNVSETEERPFGFVSFDVDRQLIIPVDVTKYATATDTTLAAAVHPGDTSLLITNASGWSNDSLGSADTRSLAWYGYTDSTGHTYANYTYTRNIAFDFDNGLWQPGAIHYDSAAGAYRINLIKPWSGPTLAAGAAIRNAASGETMNAPRVTPGLDTRQEWVTYAATIGGGVWQYGLRSEEAFRPGTVYIEPLFISTVPVGDIVVAPAGNAAASQNMATPADHHVDLDFDVLAKNALAGAGASFNGDFNANGTVDASDYALWRNNLGISGLTPFSSADGNGDGKIDQSDYQIWRNGYGGVGSVVIDSVATPQYGTATIVAGPNGHNIIHYKSNTWFIGSDVVTYTLRNTATNKIFKTSFTVQVVGGNIEQNSTLVATLAAQAQTAGNVSPKAVDDNIYETVAGQTLLGDGSHAASLLENDTDAGNTLATRLLSAPAHGTLSLKYDGTFIYTPIAGFIGTDSFRYEAFDGQFAESATATIKVVATAENLTLDNLKKIGISLQNYSDVNHRFPITNTASYFDANGNPYLSWRVFALPYLGYQSLYNQFHLNEPWNSPNNLPLASKMPDIFREPGDSQNSTTTQFQILSSEGAPYYFRRSSGLLVGPTVANFTDGTSNSFLVVETGANKAVGWTMPDQTSFDPNNPLASLGTLPSGKFHAVMADGSLITLPGSIDPTVFKSLVTISGGEAVDAGTFARQYANDHGGASVPPTAVTSDLKQLAIAMLTYADAKGSLPVASTASYFDANGQPYLSWRVHILPYIGETALYNKFHLDEPWDSPNNLPLLAEMPDIFRSVSDAPDSTTTRMETFTGPDAPFLFRTSGNQTGLALKALIDGTANTIAIAEVGADKAVVWTKPDDSPFDKNNPLAALGNLSAGSFSVAFLDGHVSTFSSDIDSAIFSALVTRGGNEVVDSGTVAGREAARNGIPETGTATTPNFKTVTLAMENFADAVKTFPGGGNFDANGLPYLSWRVQILPYLGYQALYSKFRFNEPWDSPNNLPLLDLMPDVFRSAGDPWNSVTTRMVEFTGPGAPYLNKTSGNQTGPSITQITDGSSRTIDITEVGADEAVPWTKPTDVPYYANNPFSPLGDVGVNFITSFFDGHVATQSSSIPLGLLKAYITYKGGEDTTNPPAIPNVPGFYIAQTGGNTVANELGADAFNVVLDKAPTSNVVFSLHVSDTSIASLDTAALTFTPANWNLPQRVVFRPVDNHSINPDQVVNISVSVVAAFSDDNYDPVAAQVFTATVRNDDFTAADYDHNGLIEQADYNTWRANFGGVANSALAADGNGNGSVDAADYVLWRNRISTPATGATTKVENSPSNPLATSTTSETPLVEKAAASDEVFAGLSNDRLMFAASSQGASNRTMIAFSDILVANADTLLELLLAEGRWTSDRSESAEGPTSNDSATLREDAVLATTLATDWLSIRDFS